ncbi:MAG TPA: alkaline phosphatase family protein, partial [Candidatus Acidoferrales bacterium]|nr:alkaline phosphatase family protein [Candidatus Acidoferrales bacterium]
LLVNYYAIGHNSLPNYIALVSGQAPNPVTQGDCQIYQDFFPGSPVQVAVNDQAVGQGCVFPVETQTIADQLAKHRFTWRGYMEDMPAPCTHPALNTRDQTQTAKPGDQYAARHNPFVYFHSLIDGPACAANDVPLTALPADLKHYATTPNYVFITPNLCHDGHDSPCVDGEPGGLISADAFLRHWVPQILASPAYQRDGLLLILFDEAEFSGPSADASACCNEIPGPNSPLPGITGPGGGRVGAVVLSRFVRPGTLVTTPYNHYSLLRTIEDLFGLDHLGFAGQANANSFDLDVFVAVP